MKVLKTDRSQRIFLDLGEVGIVIFLLATCGGKMRPVFAVGTIWGFLRFGGCSRREKLVPVGSPKAASDYVLQSCVFLMFL